MAPVVLLIGFTSVVAQVVVLREFLVVFEGSEISIGFALAAWLMWTATGSALAGRLGPRMGEPRRQVAALELLAAAALPLSVIAVRATRVAFRAMPGEELGPGPMLLAALAALSFFCLVSGGLFAAAARMWARERGKSPAESTGSVYLLEAAGAGLGGIVASLLLVRYATSIHAALLLSALNLIAAAFLDRKLRWIAIPALLLVPLSASPLNRLSLGWLWRGFQLVAVRNSVFGNLAVIQSEDSRSVYESGLVSMTVPDPEAAEEAVHYALLEHPRPESLLLIGGGLNGSLEQALRHPTLRRADYVELDPAVFALAERYFPAEWAAARADPRARLHLVDGRLYLKAVDARYDVIIVNLPDPRTAQLNRFYTVEFFREAARKLAPGGLISLRLTGSENYLGDERAALLACIRKTLGQVFPEVVAIPGSTVRLMAAVRRGTLTADPRVLVSRLAARNLRTVYVREYYIPFRMAPDRMTELERRIKPQPSTPVNRDFAPIACHLDLAAWVSQFHPGFGVALYWTAGAVLVPLLLLLPARRYGGAAGACVAAMGFTQIGLEMILLLGFQAVHGYVYQEISLIVAGFMAGMALGSWLALKSSASFSLRSLQLVAAASGLVVFGLLSVSHLLYPLTALACGFMGGYQFVVAGRSSPTANAGALYALDLAGSCVAAVLFGVAFIPVLGFSQSSLLIAAINLLTAAGCRR